MNHRKATHPSNKKCRNFPDGNCTWGKDCWYVHSEDLMEVDETSEKEEQKHVCYICQFQYETKDTLKKHKKKEHTSTVQKCQKYLENKCERSEESCWFIHESQFTQLNNTNISRTEQNVLKTQVFCEDQKSPFPPESVQKMMILIESLTQKIQNMDREIKDMKK